MTASSPRRTLALWGEPFTPLRFPKIYNLRTDPFERADTTSNHAVAKLHVWLAGR